MPADGRSAEDLAYLPLAQPAAKGHLGQHVGSPLVDWLLALRQVAQLVTQQAGGWRGRRVTLEFYPT